MKIQYTVLVEQGEGNMNSCLFLFLYQRRHVGLNIKPEYKNVHIDLSVY